MPDGEHTLTPEPLHDMATGVRLGACCIRTPRGRFHLIVLAFAPKRR